MKILIKKGRIIDPAQGIDKVGDLLIEGGKILRITGSIKENADKTIEAEGKMINVKVQNPNDNEWVGCISLTRKFVTFVVDSGSVVGVNLDVIDGKVAGIDRGMDASLMEADGHRNRIQREHLIGLLLQPLIRADST